MRPSGTRRIPYLDTISGVLIVFMIYTHIIQRSDLDGLPSYRFMETVFFFFLPWFFFKSGMLSKPRSLREEIRSVFHRIIIPFVFFSLVGWAVHACYLWVSGDHNPVHHLLTPLKDLYLNGALAGNQALWFLFTFALVRILWRVLSGFLPVWAILAVSGTAAFLFHFLLPDMHPYWAVNTFLGLFFFGVGNLSVEKQFCHPVPLVAILMVLAMFILSPSYVDMKSNVTVFGSYPVWFAACPAGCVAINSLIRPIRWKGLFNWLGRYSMTLLVTHWIVLEVARILYTPILGLSGHEVWFYGLACLLFLPLLCLLFQRPSLSFLVGVPRPSSPALPSDGR